MGEMAKTSVAKDAMLSVVPDVLIPRSAGYVDTPLGVSADL